MTPLENLYLMPLLAFSLRGTPHQHSWETAHSHPECGAPTPGPASCSVTFVVPAHPQRAEARTEPSQQSRLGSTSRASYS